MDCFLGCFGFTGYIRRKSHQFYRSFFWKKRELRVPRNHYASLVSYKGKGSSCDKQDLEIIQQSFDVDVRVHQEQRQEAKFRKIHGASDQHHPVSDAFGQQLGKSSRHHPSDIPETSTLSQENLNSCEVGKLEEAEHPGVEKEPDTVKSDAPPQPENQIQACGCESPSPTPLNLAPGMLTPGTIYASKPQNFMIGMIRSQFVYAVEGRPEGSFGPERVGDADESSRKLLKPQHSKDEEGIPHPYYTPDAGRPIAGAAAGHCDDDEHSRASPTQWDGNGIPNSTTKYKEDQKVSWHATPFEARLEKVLSDEKIHPQRKMVDGKIDYSRRDMQRKEN